MAEELKIQIGADTSQFNAELQKAENELKQFQNALKKTTDVKALEQLNAQVLQTQRTISTLRGSMQTVASSSNQASNSVLNLSRVVQDAPFGFIGIANNINPLIEGFGRLKKETGSTGSAFSALIGAISGPAGLGLGVAAATSLLVVFGDKLKFGKENTEQLASSVADLKSRVDATSLSIKSFNDEIDFTRKLATIEYGNNWDEYTRKINNANGASIDISTKLVKLRKEIPGLEDELTAANRALDTFAESQTGAVEQFFKSATGLNEFQEQLRAIGDVTKLTESELSNFTQKQRLQINRLIIAQNAYNVAKGQESQLVKDLELAQANARKTERDVNEARAKAEKERLKNLETVSKVLAKLSDDLRDQKAIAIGFNTSTTLAQANLVKSALEKLISDFNLDPANAVKLKVALTTATGRALGKEEIKALYNKLIAQASSEEFTRNLKPIELKPDLKITPKVISTKTDWLKSLQTTLGGAVDQFSIKISDSVYQGVVQIFSDFAAGIGEIIGAAISGQGFGDAFKALFATLGENIKSLGKQLIQTASLILIIRKNLFSKPGLALIAGIALVALGSVISNSFKRQAFAAGTRNAPGGLALVGERGPELVNIPRGSQVIPAAQTANMMGGVGQSIEVFGILRGQDIFFANKNYTKAFSRAT